jgi:hypothetical protein
MKKFKVKFSQALIPNLAVISSTLLITIFLTTLNIANANSNDLQDSPLPFLPPFQHSQSQLQPSQPHQQYQQDMNQPTQKQPLHTNEMSHIHTNSNKFDNRSPTVVSIMPY